MTERKAHWENVYGNRATDQVSWYQSHPQVSMELIQSTGLPPEGRILDVGAGASVLVDCLLDAGFKRPAVLDVSGAALAVTRERLGPRAAQVEWYEQDVLAFESPHPFDLWHDRAVFHFLTEEADRERYRGILARALAPGGYMVIGTFAEDGPLKCSGLDVARYDAPALAAVFGADFELISSLRDVHLTPAGAEQAFTFCVLRRRA
ncbi:MAG TPA: class I SAM-dependent methyltransferase [Gammaproteobacteria bacterium]|nr:class I SAM-dependent methyltransferase [Gammaproteobacteria bacterium]